MNPGTKSNPRYANGAARRALRDRALAAYDHCAICGAPIDKSLKTPHPLSAEVDEIIPVSRGGSPLDWNNIQLTHRICNQRKGNKIQAGMSGGADQTSGALRARFDRQKTSKQW